RMVVRAAGRMTDPLAGDAVPRVPLSFRSDGAWVWSEAAAYYLGTYGVAPEMELLRHIEERAYVLPTDITDSVVRQGAPHARRPPPPPPLPRTVPTYFTGASGALFRRWEPHSRPAFLGTDLRWHGCAGDWTLPWHEVAEISEAEAAHAVDARWAIAAN